MKFPGNRFRPHFTTKYSIVSASVGRIGGTGVNTYDIDFFLSRHIKPLSLVNDTMCMLVVGNLDPLISFHLRLCTA